MPSIIYYNAFDLSDNPYTDCTPFIEYMLNVFANTEFDLLLLNEAYMSLQGYLCKLSLCTAVYLPIFIGPRGNPEPSPAQQKDGLFGNILNMDSKQTI